MGILLGFANGHARPPRHQRLFVVNVAIE